MLYRVKSWEIAFLVYILLNHTVRSSSKVRIKTAEKCIGCGKNTPISLCGMSSNLLSYGTKLVGGLADKAPVGLTMGGLMYMRKMKRFRAGVFKESWLEN